MSTSLNSTGRRRQEDFRQAQKKFRGSVFERHPGPHISQFCPAKVLYIPVSATWLLSFIFLISSELRRFLRGVRFVFFRPGRSSWEAGALSPAASTKPTAWIYIETYRLLPTQFCCNVHNVHDVHSSSRERPSVDVLMSGPSSQVVTSLSLRSQSGSNTGQRQWQVR
jgi:hypothetical protein